MTSSEEIRNRSYDAIDILLKDLAAQKISSISGLQLPMDSNEQDYALQILKQYNLIEFKNKASETTSPIDITEPGLKVVDLGGIRFFFGFLEQRKKFKTRIESLEKEVFEMTAANRDKDEELRKLQIRLTKQQNNELTYKRLWAISGAIIGALFTYALSHWVK